MSAPVTFSHRHREGRPIAGVKDRDVESELPLVYSIARDMYSRIGARVPYDDLVQTGVIGLIESLRRYNSEKNVPFAVYAQARIRGAMVDSIRELDWVPRSLRRKARIIESIRTRLSGCLHRTITDEDIATDLGLPVQKIQKISADVSKTAIYSLDSFKDEHARCPIPLSDSMTQTPKRDPYYTYLAWEQRRLIRGAIMHLPPRERLVLHLRYFRDLKLIEIAQLMGVGESRVSQLHATALKRLRNRMAISKP